MKQIALCDFDNATAWPASTNSHQVSRDDLEVATADKWASNQTLRLNSVQIVNVAE
jgi:hypothetical protein